MKAYVQLARVRNFFEFFALLHANLSGHWSVKQRPASRASLTSSRPTSSRQWSLVGPKIRPSGRENRVAQTSLHSVAYLLYSTCALPVRSDSTVQPCLHHRHNLAKWLSLDELRYRPAVFTSTCTRPKPLHIRALPPITSRYSLTEDTVYRVSTNRFYQKDIPENKNKSNQEKRQSRPVFRPRNVYNMHA
ncbi:5-methyltetrahydropteroyltriglutamate--homocysteine methyltransferase [Trichinella pseudospiralis]